MNIRYADSTFGTMAAYAALVALRHARNTGVGQFVDVSAVECMSSMIGDAIMDYTLNGVIRTCDGNRHEDMAPHGVYPCANGEWLCIAAPTEAAWRALAGSMGRPELAEQPAFDSLDGRQANADELDALLAAWTADKEAAALAAALQECGVAAAKSLNSLDLVADPHLWARGFYRQVLDRDGQARTTLGPGWRMSGEAAISRAAPHLGEHTARVLGEVLGISEERQRQLAEQGVTR
jgi:crotonobetainyl-CoA:carnitine CoA-transferase CaiB-like acyl-CoA transferase